MVVQEPWVLHSRVLVAMYISQSRFFSIFFSIFFLRFPLNKIWGLSFVRLNFSLWHLKHFEVSVSQSKQSKCPRLIEKNACLTKAITLLYLPSFVQFRLGQLLPWTLYWGIADQSNFRCGLGFVI